MCTAWSPGGAFSTLSLKTTSLPFSVKVYLPVSFEPLFDSTVPETSFAFAGGGAAFLSPLANASVPTKSDIPIASLFMTASSALDADHPGQAGNIAQNFRNALEKIDRCRPLLDDVNRNLGHALALALGADHELGGEQVARELAALERAGEPLAPEGLEPVRVGAVKADQHPQHPVDHQRRRVAHEAAPIFRALHHLGADHQIGLVVLQDPERALVEVGVAEIDLVAQDEGAARALDARLERAAVVRRAQRVDRDLRIFLRQLLADRDGAIARAVLGQEDLVAPAELVERRDQIDHRGVQDPLFVVDGDDDGDVG